MSLSVNTNVASLTAQTALQSSQSRLNTSLQRLSTGLQINSAADNPAGLVTSSLQASQISGLQTSLQNIATGTSLAQTADSSLANINNLLVQVRTLAANSANAATQSTTSLTANNTSAQALLTSITNIANNTKFGTVALLDGSFTASTDTQFQTGAFSGQTANLALTAADSATLGVSGIDISTGAGATAALALIDTAITTVATERGTIGSFIAGTLNATSNNNQSQLTNLQSAQSTLTDTNYQTEIANYTSENIRQQAASTVLGFANQSSQSILSLLKNA